MNNLARICLTALLSPALTAAALEALIEHDFAIINNGKSYELLQPVNQTKFGQRFPFAPSTEMVISFPYRDGVSIKSISASPSFERPGKVFLQKYENGAWSDVASAKDFNFTFAVPLQTTKLKVILTEITNADHDILYYSNFKIQGEGLGPQLVNAGMLTLTCNAPDNVFELNGQPPQANAIIRNTTAIPQTFQVKGEFQHYIGGQAEADTPFVITLQPGESHEYTLKMRGANPGPYLATVSVGDLAKQAILVGLRDPEIASGAKSPARYISPGMKKGVPNLHYRERLKTDGTLWTADASHCLGGKRLPEEAFFAKLGADGAELTMAISAYHDFEPLPGVYNFEWSDRLVERSGLHGLGLELGIWHWDFNGPSQFWLKPELRRGLDGKEGTRWLGIPSLFSSRFTTHARRAAEVMVQRYLDCPEVWVWALHPYGVVDHDNTGLYDTHPEALAAFRAMLKQKYGTIAALNQAYGQQYPDFESVPVPESLADRLTREGKSAEAVSIVDQRREWLDYLGFYHDRVVEVRKMFAQTVRKYDDKRALSGMNASGGVGNADGQYRIFAEYDGFYGDQGLNLKHYFRRYIAQRRYNLPLRHEDIAPVKVGRGVTAGNVTERCNWNVFQSVMLGLAHFNYVFTCWTDNEFYDTVFTNSHIKKLIKDAMRLEGNFVQAGYHHSLLSDVRVGRYSYKGISTYRWWLMNAMYTSMLENGVLWEAFADHAGAEAMDKMKLIFDDGSPVLDKQTADRLAAFVHNGGKLVLTSASGEYLSDETQPSYYLLRRLGYTAELNGRNSGNTAIELFGNPLNINNYVALAVPEGGRILSKLPDGKPGAVAWPHGQGEVLLWAGNPGANDELALTESSKPGEKRHNNDIWRNAEPRLVKEFTPLLNALNAWAGIKPQYILNQPCYSAMRSSKTEQLICIFNQLPKAQSLTLKLPETAQGGQLLVIDLKGEQNLGNFSAEQLRNGIELPELKSQRFMAIKVSF